MIAIKTKAILIEIVERWKQVHWNREMNDVWIWVVIINTGYIFECDSDGSNAW